MQAAVIISRGVGRVFQGGSSEMKYIADDTLLSRSREVFKVSGNGCYLGHIQEAGAGDRGTV